MSEPKSPRDWLLARHAPAQPQLDALRRSALPAHLEDISVREFLARLFRPQRRAWQTLALIWLALLALQFSQRSVDSHTGRASVSPEAFAAWLAQAKTHEALAQINRHP